MSRLVVAEFLDAVTRLAPRTQQFERIGPGERERDELVPGAGPTRAMQPRDRPPDCLALEVDYLANVGGYIAAAERGDDPNLDLDVYYEDADIEAVDEETLRLYEFVQEWSELPDSAVDTTANIVSETITEFDPDGRVFGPFGET